MWELDYKEGWAQKNWCFWTTVVLEKTLESPLDCNEIQLVHPKGDQSWVFSGRTDVEAETPITGHLIQKADSQEKTLMLGKIEGRRRRGRQRMCGDDRGWDGWMASPTQRTQVWVDSRSWWWTEAWHAMVHGVAKSRTRLSNLTELNDSVVKNLPVMQETRV